MMCDSRDDCVPPNIVALLAAYDQSPSSAKTTLPRAALSNIVRYSNRLERVPGDNYRSTVEWETSTGYRFQYTHTRVRGRLYSAECSMYVDEAYTLLSRWRTRAATEAEMLSEDAIAGDTDVLTVLPKVGAADDSGAPTAPPAALNKFVTETLGGAATDDDKSQFVHHYFTAVVCASLSEMLPPVWTASDFALCEASD